jgi:hypothetical protein
VTACFTSYKTHAVEVAATQTGRICLELAAKPAAILEENLSFT